MPIGMTFDEFFELKLKPNADADPAFHEAAEQEQDALFPMPTTAVAHHLRRRGYDVRPQMLELLLECGTLRTKVLDSWTREEVDDAAAHFEDCQIFVPYAAMCETLGCTYADFHRALRETAETESRKHGRRLPEDDQYFVMHRFPPRDDAPAKLWFTLADDIRERLERGEEV